ncbi:M48 family metallopeptidase [Amylibacter sp.]|nr:M48 family metallopeptidase [Amylibacter sp.]
MNDFLLIGDPPIEVYLRNNSSAKRYSLRISNKDNKVSLTLPRWSNLKEAKEFAQSQEEWMRKHLSQKLKPIQINFGKYTLLDGKKILIRQGSGKAVRVINNELFVPGSDEELCGKLRAFYKTLARERLMNSSDYYAKILGCKIKSITLRDTTTRWGSCTSNGRLMYSWRLMMAPPEVQDYVAAHEVCHLIEMNHSPDYWKLVESVVPTYKSDRSWLKINGNLLHQYML